MYSPRQTIAGDNTETAAIPERTRSSTYQMEILRDSLKRNIIITMDTRAELMQIAVIRVRAMLETGIDKICWYLVPNARLGFQRYQALTTSLPPVDIQFLGGGDNCYRWKRQKLWDKVLGLEDRRHTVVVSTHKVLLYALTYGFVRIQEIGLLIFEEGYLCTANHPAARIVKEFYHPNCGKFEVPGILGLTSSEAAKSKSHLLIEIESNLNAISRTPVLDREELLKLVHQPNFRSVLYPSHYPTRKVTTPVSLDMRACFLGVGVDTNSSWDERTTAASSSISPVESSIKYRNIYPKVKEIFTNPSTASRTIFESNLIPVGIALNKTIHQHPSQSLAVFDSLQNLCRDIITMGNPHTPELSTTKYYNSNKTQKQILQQRNDVYQLMSIAEHIRAEYGDWASEWYITSAVGMVLSATNRNDRQGLSMNYNEEDWYLKDALKRVIVSQELGAIAGRVSNKVEKLIDTLRQEYCDTSGVDFAGLVLVKDEIGISILAEIIRSHPLTKGIFNTGTLVGGLGISRRSRRRVYEFVGPHHQGATMEDLQARTRNLIIAACSAEEGIDTRDCNLVVCFSLPSTMKSFIQRQGRPKRIKSTCILMVKEGPNSITDIAEFQRLAKEMIEDYADKRAKLETAWEREEIEVDEDGVLAESERRIILAQAISVPTTLESAVSQLLHFCASLPRGVYTDLRPIFTTYTEEGSELYRADVALPNCLPTEVRHAVSKNAWKTKRWAKHDAAFEAYLALCQLKVDPLINDRLQLDPAPKNAPRSPKNKRAKIMVDKTIDPWAGIEMNEGTILYATHITLRMFNSKIATELDMLTPFECPHVEKVLVYWSKAENGEVTVGESRCLGIDRELVAHAKKVTYKLFQTVFLPRMEKGMMDFPYLFIPRDKGQDWGSDEIPLNALQTYITHGPVDNIGILKDTTKSDVQYIICQWRTDISPLNHLDIVRRYGERTMNPDQPLIEAVRLPGRRDFLHEISGETASETTELLLPEFCTVEKIPWRYSQLALVLPGVIRRIEMALIASNLQQTLLSPVGIRSTSKILTAISAPSAREFTDYQRFEFLGDLVLKFLSSINILDEYPLRDEGYLSAKKAKIVANSHLARTARDIGLAKWIITDSFTGLKWKPRYVTAIDNRTDKTPTAERELSTKILADVVEALIGAAYLEGGYTKALACIATFGLGTNWKPLPTRMNSLLARAALSPPAHVSYLRDLEKLIGYKFKNQTLLIEAITNPSCESISPPYQRLQFLGDALLDMLVIDELFFCPKRLPPVQMHLYKSSVVAGNFLAYLSMGYSVNVESPKVEQIELKGITTFKVVERQREVNIWQFLDLQHSEMANAQRVCWNRYQGGLKDKIQTALETGRFYPWAELSAFQADRKGDNKFLSDMVQAIMGAVFVDSGGNFEAVVALVGELGVFKWLRRLVRDDVNVIHPVTRLEEMVAPLQKGKLTCSTGIENGQHVCTIWFDNEVLAIARSGNKTESRTVAAEIALNILGKPVGSKP